MMIQNNIHTMTGSKAVIETLKALNTDTIFGYPGGIVLNLYDELYNNPDIKHILLRHEQSVVHAAEGYARVSGRCGVVLVTSGPGATNTLTGIANAYMDGYPLVVITGQVENNLIGTNAFQEADICSMAKPCTKATFQIKDAQYIQPVLAKAFEIAMSGKKGPVLVDIPKDVLSQNVEYKDIPVVYEKYNDVEFDYTKADKIYNLIMNTTRPVVVAGGGLSHSKAYGLFENFISKYNLPFVSTMMGLGSFEMSDNYFGMVGIFGDNCANEILMQSDLIISLGARFNDRITCKLKGIDLPAKFVQIDINGDEIGRTIKPFDYLICDIKDFLQFVVQKDCSGTECSQWLNDCKSFKNLNTEPQKTTNMMHSFEVIRQLETFTEDKDVIFASEVGQHQVWAVKNLKFNPERKILLSGGLGTMGFGLPGSIGACIANPARPVVCITGDGSLQMSIGELSVCKDYGLNLKIIILNNGYLGMVRQLQQNNYCSRYSQTKISNPDFVQMAQSFGIDGVKANTISDLKQALDKAFGSDKTFIINCEIEPMEII